MSLVGKPAPDFTAEAVVGGKIEPLSLAQYKGKALFLFFYPYDFTHVCPTEIHAFSDSLSAFHKRGVEVLACSTDSVYSHRAWLSTPRVRGGIEYTDYPLLADPTHSIARDYGVLIEEKGCALRGSFLIDKQGIVQMEQVYALPLGRSIGEIIRVIDMLAFYETYGESCPAGWDLPPEDEPR